MDNLRRPVSRRHPSPAGKQPLPSLTRSRSQNPATSPASTTTTVSNKSYSGTKSRSKSTTKVRNYKETEAEMDAINFMIRLTSPVTRKKPAPTTDAGGSRDGTFLRFLPRKTPTSPSAWALSPGRASPACTTLMPPKSPSSGARAAGAGGGGIGGVLKYFRQKKVASSEEADRRSFKVMNNRLLQWRFANARAESTMSTVNVVAETKVFNAWVNILAIRNSNMGKRIEVQKLKNEIKLHHIMNSQLFLLERWSRLKDKNFEAVGRVVRKLSVASVNLPLVDDSKGDVLEICNVLDDATRLLEDIESTMKKLYYQVEKSCYLLTELSVIAKQEKDSLTELQTWVLNVASLKVQHVHQQPPLMTNSSRRPLE